MHKTAVHVGSVMSLALLALSACGGSDSDEPTTVASLRSAPATTQPTPSSRAPSPPVAKPIAREQSLAGAAAFVEHYLETLEYAFTSGDSAAIARLSTPSCGPCSRSRKVIDDAYTIGHRWTTGNYRLMGAEAVPGDLSGNVVVNAVYSTTVRRELTPAGSVVATVPPRSKKLLEFTLVRRGNAWAVDGIVEPEVS
jgi:Family of unknown function (DUF6318)